MCVGREQTRITNEVDSGLLISVILRTRHKDSAHVTSAIALKSHNYNIAAKGKYRYFLELHPQSIRSLFTGIRFPTIPKLPNTTNYKAEAVEEMKKQGTAAPKK